MAVDKLSFVLPVADLSAADHVPSDTPTTASS